MVWRFFRPIFLLYEKHPLISNTIAGGFVFGAGEIAAQWFTNNDKFLSVTTLDTNFSNLNFNWNRARDLSLVGSIENGGMMLCWYNFLNKTIGSGVSTQVVLTKCLFDQIFFATQQDAVFLAFSAFNQQPSYEHIVRELRIHFFTIWINDCSVWPLINFIAFATLPFYLQPTFMSIAQFFWQVYLSSAVMTTRKLQDINDSSKIYTQNSSEIHLQSKISIYFERISSSFATTISRYIPMHCDEIYDDIWQFNRNVALKNAFNGTLLLISGALVRKIIFKL